jgi:outer membrane lipoprotein carrier protein
MKFKEIFLLWFSLTFFFVQAGLSQEAKQTPDPTRAPAKLSLADIIDRVESRYAVSGFSARFNQFTTITAMDITDTASGQIFVKRPGMMRWEYKKPDVQTIITNGIKLWIYRPEDNQVMIGKAPAFFKDGKGAGFLSDLKQLRRQFHITLGNEIVKDSYILTLYPLEKTFDVSVIYLSISLKTFDVVRIVTFNSYGDKTRFELSDIQFNQSLDDALFTFEIPEGIEVLKLDQQQ